MRSLPGSYCLLFLLAVLAACSSPDSGNTKTTSPVAATAREDQNFLTMKVNGIEWKADHDITGIVHPKGYNNAILIAGKFGPVDKTEQTFNLNLYNASEPGVFDFVSGNKDLCEVQLANLSDEHYLYGNVLGFSFHTQIVKMQKSPAILEALFEGVLTGNTGDSVKITDGKFYFHE
jgi:hypothetical protein